MMRLSRILRVRDPEEENQNEPRPNFLGWEERVCDNFTSQACRHTEENPRQICLLYRQNNCPNKGRKPYNTPISINNELFTQLHVISFVT